MIRMADGEQSFVDNNEAQVFLMQDSDQHHLEGFGQQTLVGNLPDEYHFGGNESDNQALQVNEQTFIPHDEEPDTNFGVLSDQVFADNQTVHSLDRVEGIHGVEDIHGLDGDEIKQEFASNEAGEAGNDPDNSNFNKKVVNGNGNGLTVVGAEKKWPGWPGESVFRMLVPAQKVGNIIGRKGEFIKKMVEETRARIKVLDGSPGSQERAVLVSAKEDPDASLSPAMNGLLSVHRRIVDGLDTDPSQAQAPPAAGKVSTRLLVPATQTGSLIGKQGATVKSIQESAGCIVRVLGQEDLPVFALQDDRVVEIVGEAVDVHKAVELVGSHLRKFLVDRSIIPIFEKQMQAPSAPMLHMPPQPWDPPHNLLSSGGGLGGYNMQYMQQPPPRQLDNYYPPAQMAPPPDRQLHQGTSAYGREPPVAVHVSTNAQPVTSMITQITQLMQVPLIYADTVIGANGATISYIRRASGATVTIQETRSAPGEMTVEVNGTASQVQAAQQLIQNYMAEAEAAAAAAAAGAAAAATATTVAPTAASVTDQGVYSQGYNSYAAAPAPSAAPVYGSAPASAGHATQPGAYGVYGANYGY